MKVSAIWREIAIILIGFALGVFVTLSLVKRNLPPSQSIEIGNITIKAKKGSTVTDAVDVTKQDVQDTGKKKRNRNK